MITCMALYVLNFLFSYPHLHLPQMCSVLFRVTVFSIIIKQTFWGLSVLTAFSPLMRITVELLTSSLTTSVGSSVLYKQTILLVFVLPQQTMLKMQPVSKLCESNLVLRRQKLPVLVVTE